jgi:hypothetical protein
MAAWISVMVNSKEGALMKAFDDNGRHGPKVNQGFLELQQAIIRYVLRLPGNDRCADCCSQNGTSITSRRGENKRIKEKNKRIRTDDDDDDLSTFERHQRER